MEENHGNLNDEKCEYCEGDGYFQLLLGGSETCENCAGSGLNKE